MDQTPPASSPSTSGERLHTEPPARGSIGRCGTCHRLTIDQLLRWKQIDHHSSLGALERYAALGCDFCQFILDCLKTTVYGQRGVSVDSGDPGYIDWMDGNQSLYSIAKETDQPSPITFTISQGIYHKSASREVHTIEIPEAKEVYETLLVQVGELPAMEFNLIVPRGDNIYIDEYNAKDRQHARHRVGRYPIHPDLGSPVNLGIAKGWLDDCRVDHAECRPVKPPSLPTRVLDVGISEGLDSCRLVETGNKEGNYVALSHCWGAKIKERLTTETLFDFLRCIQIAQLPANFRDAIHVTRQLGMRYLWIDALCILQDCKEDWASESEKMGSIYQDSTLTIFAMTSKGSEEGFLKTVNPRHPNPTTLKVSPAANNQTSVLVAGREFKEEHFSWLRHGSPLSTRGWAFQEVILSRRSLFFGARQLYWQCRQGFDNLEGLCLASGGGGEAMVVVPQTHGQPERSDANARSDFYTLASAYNSKALTYSSDKLPAFSGLAQKYQHTFGGEYLAGLWSNDICRGLLWLPFESLLPDSAAQPNRLPSWSWGSTTKLLYFNSPEPQVFLKFHHSDIQLCDPQNRYGNIRSENDATRPSITVIGMTMPLARGNRILDRRDQGPTIYGYVHFDLLEGLEKLVYNRPLSMPLTIVDDSFMLSLMYPRDWRWKEEGKEEDAVAGDLYPGLKCNYLALAVSGELSDECKEVHGLVLHESGDAFKRVGIWEATLTNRGWKGWQRDQVLKLV